MESWFYGKTFINRSKDRKSCHSGRVCEKVFSVLHYLSSCKLHVVVELKMQELYILNDINCNSFKSMLDGFRHIPKK